MKRLACTLLIASLSFGCGSQEPDETPEGTVQNDAASPMVDEPADVAVPEVDDTADRRGTDQDALPEFDTDDALVDDTQADETDSEEPAEPTLEDYMRRVQEAMRADDIDQAVVVLEEAREQFPDNDDIAVSLLSVLMRRDTGIDEADQEEAAAAFKATAAVARDVFEDGDMPDRFQPLWYTALYNEARAYASEGETDKAIESLSQAFEAGFDRFGLIKEDSFFEKIATDETLNQWIDDRLQEKARQDIAQSEPFPFDFELTNLEGETVTLDQFEGKLVIVDIWGTWCPPCRMEVPHFIQLQDTYPEDLAIVGINYENSEGEEAVQAIQEYADKVGINYTLVVGDQETQAQIPEFQGFPTTMFFDREGDVKLKVVGYKSYEVLEAYIKELMNTTAQPAS